MWNSISARAALALAVGLALSVPALRGTHQDPKKKLVILNASRVYHPAVVAEGTVYKKCAVVVSRTVFDATPEYKQIAKRKLSPNTAEWCLLVKQASDKFRNAVSKVVQNGGYDLVAESGAISIEGETIPDITSDVVAQLPAE